MSFYASMNVVVFVNVILGFFLRSQELHAYIFISFCSFHFTSDAVVFSQSIGSLAASWRLSKPLVDDVVHGSLLLHSLRCGDWWPVAPRLYTS